MPVQEARAEPQLNVVRKRCSKLDCNTKKPAERVHRRRQQGERATSWNYWLTIPCIWTRKLRRLLQPRKKDLPDAIETQDGVCVYAQELVETALPHILGQDMGPPGRDKQHLGELLSELGRLRRRVETNIRADVGCTITVVSMEMIDRALRRIRVSAHCRGLPYAAIRVKLPSSREFHAAAQGLAIDLGKELVCTR